MKMRKLFIAALALCLMLVMLPATASAAEVASGTCGENVTWTLTDDGVLTISGEGEMYDYTAKSDNLAPWKQPTAGAIVKKIVIEFGVTGIGDYAFSSNVYLKEVTIADTVTSIGESAFAGAGFEKIEIPAGVTSLENSVFSGCRYLTEFTIPAGVTSIGDCTFYECYGLTELEIPAGVTSIGAGAFSGCSGLTKLEIPSGVTSIGTGAFRACSGLTEMVIPEGIDAVDNGMFANCTSLTTVDIPDSVTRIGERAFYKCESLTKLKLPASVQSIEREAFWECTSLTEINIPDGITVMSMDVFRDCESLTEIKLPDSVTEINQGAFDGCSKLVSVNIPDGVTYIGCSAFRDCTRLKSITIPDKVTVVDDGAFADCTGMTSVTFKDDPNVKNSNLEIEPYVFENCTSLTKVTLPADLKEMDTGAFQNCRKLASITIPDNVTLIGTSVFEDCGSLKTVYFADDPAVADSKLSVGSQAFYCCEDLVTVRFPKDLATLGQECLAYCDEVDKVIFTGDAPKMGTEMFSNTQPEAYYPAGNATWTSQVKKNYAGTVTWVAYSEEPTVPVAPAAPVVKGSNVASTGKVKLTWAKVDGAANYQVYRSASKSSGYKLMKTTTGTQYINTSAPAGSTYYYYVVAINAQGEKSAKSNILLRTTDCASPVVKASNVASIGKVKLTWEEVEGAVKYQVYRSASKSGEYTLMMTTSGTTYTNTSAKAGTQYYYKVKALGSKEAAASAYSDVVTRTCDYARPVVTASNDAATGKIKLTWEKVDGASKYEVYRATSKSGEYTLLNTVSGTSFVNNSAVVGKQYYYKVRAIGAKTAAASDYSTVVTRTCDLRQTTVSITLNSAGKPKLTWNAITGAVSYKVYRATSEDGKYSLMKTVTGTTYTNTSADPYTTYYYKVVAVHSNEEANSAYSSVKFINSTSVNVGTSELAKDALDLINDYRDAAGLSELSWAQSAEIAARTRAAELAVYPYYERPDGTDLEDFMMTYDIGMECSYSGCTTAEEAVEFMMSIEDGEYVLMDFWDSVVVAHNGDYWTFLFIMSEEYRT